MRGCKHLCKFCQAGVACRPRRERSVAKIIELAKAAYDSTGYEEISLVSLSSGDHTEIKEIFTRLHEIFKDRAVSVSMPSLRIEDIAGELPQLIKEVRKAGLTFAPESGSARLRKIINKDIDTEKLLSASVEAYKAGWKRIKLYFMIGLPGETEEDLAATAELARRVSEARRDVGASAGFVTASIAPFVPKPHTPFQWHAMEARRALEGRQAFLRGLNSKRSKVKLDFHDLDISFLEGVFSRGDRRAGDVIEEAWRLGARLDSWREYFNMDRWMDSFARCGIDPAFYVHRGRPHDEPLPWDFIDLGMPKDRLVTGSESF
jgi:radical SAM superfamily enzyme YgiQ (UPF0313 family)